MSDVKRLIGNRVRRLRKERGLSQEELGFKAQLHHTYVGAVERGEKNVSIDSLERISEGLGVKLDEILNHLTGSEDEKEMRAFVSQEIKSAGPDTLKIVFDLSADRQNADRMRSFLKREIEHCSSEIVKVVFDLLKGLKNLQGPNPQKHRSRK